MMKGIYQGSWELRLPAVVRFGPGSIETLASEPPVLAARRVGIVSDRGVEKAGFVARAEALLRHDGTESVTVFSDLSGEPTFGLLKRVLETMREANCDLILGIGGGSAMDTAKATAALQGKDDPESYMTGSAALYGRTVPCLLLPTTAGTGSEVTDIAVFGDEERGVKRGLVGKALLADAAIVDPLLTLSCPPRVSAASGVDAFTHAIESYLAVRSTPLTDLYAEQAMELIVPSIAKAVHQGEDKESRSNMSLASLYAGISLANAGVGAIHALAYPLGGVYHIEHGVANALLMPYVIERTGVSEPIKMAKIASLLRLGDFTRRPHEALDTVVAYMHRMIRELELPATLRELGVEQATLPELARSAAKIDRLLCNTPYRLTERHIEEIYRNAYNGWARG